MVEEQVKQDEKLSEYKISYLQMIQSNIERMSTSSAIFKGFSATIVAGISMISFSDIDVRILVMSFFPVGFFFALDIYYYWLEKKYRKLYEDVLTGKHEIDFNLDISKYNKANLCQIIGDALKSPSIYLFYPGVIIILIIVVCLKANMAIASTPVG